MRSQTVMTWIFVGFGLVTVGSLLPMFEVIEDGNVAIFLITIGFVYLITGFALGAIHSCHMAKRWRAREE